MRRIEILVADPSLIIRRGITSLLLDMEHLSIDVTEIADLSQLTHEIKERNPDLLIINPIHLGITPLQELLPKGVDTLTIALQSHLASTQQLAGYEAILPLDATATTIEATLQRVMKLERLQQEERLSAREREVVRAIALGRSNKEIADELFISTHTVVTHRKNIANKLKIHNSAGITIYAIVNKLIDIGEVK